VNSRSKDLTDRIKGLIHLVVTHFDAEGELDLNALRVFLRHAVNSPKRSRSSPGSSSDSACTAEPGDEKEGHVGELGIVS
jgi:hypothetical protein